MPLSQPGEQSTKCLLAFKHFISVVLHRNDLEDTFKDDMKKRLLDVISQPYWAMKEDEVRFLKLNQSEPYIEWQATYF